MALASATRSRDPLVPRVDAVTLPAIRLPSRIAILIFAVLLAAFARSSHAQQRCGYARWPVKTGSDEDIAAVDTLPVPITVAELAGIPRPRVRFPNAKRVAPFEARTFVLRARVARIRVEDDSDIHLLLRDLKLPNVTVLAEIPSGSCTTNRQFAQRFEDARRALGGLPRNGMVEITGIGFFDSFHRRSRTRNGFEIHPVLSLRVLRP